MPLRLIIEDDEGTTTIVALASEPVTIGRQKGNTIQLTEKNVSRRHARLYPESDFWVIEDLGSYNGVSVNGQPIEGRVRLAEGDVVQIGDYHLALTEDVDKHTLNVNGGAANDASEPLLITSSTELPQISEDELSTAKVVGSAVDVLPLPDAVGLSRPEVERSRREPQRKSRFWVSAGAVVLMGVVGAFVGVSMGGGDSSSETSSPAEGATLSQTVVESSHAGPSLQEQEANQVDPPSIRASGSDASAVVGIEGRAMAPTDAEPDGVEDTAAADLRAEGVDGALLAEDPADFADGSEEPEGDDAASPKREKDRKKPVSRSATSSEEAVVLAPQHDPEALLKEARNLLFKDARRAYRLAKEAHESLHSQDALVVMATSACLLGHESAARKAIAQLRGEPRQRMVAFCQKQGVGV